MKRKPARTAFHRVIGFLSASVALLLSGCGPINGEALEEFILDFGRTALAAWLL